MIIKIQIIISNLILLWDSYILYFFIYSTFSGNGKKIRNHFFKLKSKFINSVIINLYYIINMF